ncbi:hypothetical protein Hypma_000435 [Hypsizygus marmoreus]|uniref:Uncharacterized protein n=1 Tax=Hypsizygus marmoreus TaxID=39966 RepID=A0A369JFD4_HYPMA|nr:hypothetical protein Hypma_000435 [Hypsizygus marmoreus]
MGAFLGAGAQRIAVLFVSKSIRFDRGRIATIGPSSTQQNTVVKSEFGSPGYIQVYIRRVRMGLDMVGDESSIVGVATRISLAPFLHQAICAEFERHENGEGDNEGLPLSTSPDATTPSRPICKLPQRISTRSATRSATPKPVSPACITSSNSHSTLPSPPKSRNLPSPLKSCTRHSIPSTSQTPAPPEPRPRTLARTQEVARNKLKSKNRRSVQRSQDATAPPTLPFSYRPPLTNPALQVSGLPSSRLEFESESLPAAGGHWIGKLLKRVHRMPSLEDLKDQGFKLFAWDGITPHALTDKEGRIITYFAGVPKGDTSWPAVTSGADKFMGDMRLRGHEQSAFTAEQLTGRRGDFVALACGVSHGGGQTLPAAFAYCAPKVYEVYKTNLDALFAHDKTLRANFSNSIFPATTFNLGPITITLEHTDHGNVAYGLCALTALGDYDPKFGGHLILFDLGLVIEFPPGSTILLPSSVLRHGNCRIQDGETRRSISQYCAGGLFRWVRYGFKGDKDISKSQKRKFDGDNDERTKEALGLFSTLTDLAADQRSVFSR